MSSNNKGKKRRRNNKGNKANNDNNKQNQKAKSKNPRKDKQKVSSGAGRKRKGKRGSTKGKPAIDLAQARLELIIKSKYQNPFKPTPSKLEEKICQLLVDLEASSKDLKPHLRDLGIVSARKIQVNQTKKAIVIFVPKLQHQRWQKLQDRLVRELEKNLVMKMYYLLHREKS